jgi:hypothetical protein
MFRAMIACHAQAYRKLLLQPRLPWLRHWNHAAYVYFREATYIHFDLRPDRDVIVLKMHACVMKWRIVVDSRAAFGFDGGADDTLLRLATAARGLRSDICVVNEHHFSHISELAEGIDHHV